MDKNITTLSGTGLNSDDYIIPEGHQHPAWVEHRMIKFKEEIQRISKNDSSDKITKDNLTDALETYILHESYKVTKPVTDNEISNIIKIYDDKISNDIEFMWYYYLLLNAGFILNSLFPSSFSPEVLELPQEFKKKKNQLENEYKEGKITEYEYQKSLSDLADDLGQYLTDNGYDLMDLINSGAKGNIDHIKELLLGLGMSVSATGEINDIIGNSLSDGVEQTQFFNKSSTAIGALYAKSIETAKPGYLGRRLNAVGERVVLSSKKDCNSKKYLKLRVKDANFQESLNGRILKSGEQIDNEMNLINKIIEIRSALYCLAEDGICETCYNPLYVKNWKLKKGAPIGIMASTNCTGSLVNLTLKKSHVGINSELVRVNFKEDLNKMF